MHTNKFRENATYNWSKDSIRLLLTPSKEAKAIYYYIQEIGGFKTTYPYYLERENLNSHLIIFTLQGEGVLEYQGKTYTLEKGQCCFINCMEYHKYFTKQSNEWEFLWVHFNGPNVLGHHELFSRNAGVVLNFKEGSKVEVCMRTLLNLNKNKNSTTEIETSKLLYVLLSELLIHNHTRIGGDFMIPDHIKEIAKEMDKDFKNELSLDYFAEKYHRSKYHLAKEFKKYIGDSMHEYLILNRISYAKELLKYTNASIEVITYEIGMNHVSHFINLFKEREHTTPLRFRREWRE